MESDSSTPPPPSASDKPKRKPAKAVLPDGALEKWTPRRVHRSQLKNATYNPRTIADDARRKLRENLETVGLLAPIIWNVRTGSIVGGHQRMNQMDALMGTADYHLTVAEVDLDPKTEKEQNVFLNNGQAQGDWDFEKLGELFKAGDIDVSATGFDAADIKDLFGGDVLNAKDLAELSDAVGAAQKMAGEISADADVSQDNNFYAVLIFRDDGACSDFARWLGLRDDRYIDSARVLRAVQEKITAGEPVPESLLRPKGGRPG